MVSLDFQHGCTNYFLNLTLIYIFCVTVLLHRTSNTISNGAPRIAEHVYLHVVCSFLQSSRLSPGWYTIIKLIWACSYPLTPQKHCPNKNLKLEEVLDYTKGTWCKIIHAKTNVAPVCTGSAIQPSLCYVRTATGRAKGEESYLNIRQHSTSRKNLHQTSVLILHPFVKLQDTSYTHFWDREKPLFLSSEVCNASAQS